MVRTRHPLVSALVLHSLFVAWTFQAPLVNGAWLGSFFTAGIVLWAASDRVRPSWALGGAAFLVWVVIGTLGLGRELGPLPLAALVLAVSAIAPVAWCETHDLSYGTYLIGFPVQQLLAAAGLSSVGVMLFAVISAMAVLPLAALSWLFVERPALRAGWGGRSRRFTVLRHAEGSHLAEEISHSSACQERAECACTA
jgi:peptidoglycan/LPS O-acetylase OafA/YrhL